MPRFDLVAAVGTDTARMTHNLRPPVEKAALPLEGKVIVDSSEFAPRGNLLLRDEERTTVSVRIPANAMATLVTGAWTGDTGTVISGRTLPNENYKWFLLPNTVAELTGRVGAWDRVRVAEDQEMWVADADVDSVVPRPARRVTANSRIRATPLSADLVIPMTS